jgi:serine/threonine protein kinase
MGTHRYKIALGVGSAILYLHTECEQCVVHGDIKPPNIMLDASHNAKLGDFGLARLADLQTTQIVAGTLGYIDPEFVNSRRPSAESDVYSFGVVLLETACGRRPTSTQQSGRTRPALVNWVRDMYRQGCIHEPAVGRRVRRAAAAPRSDSRSLVHASGPESATVDRASHGCPAT